MKHFLLYLGLCRSFFACKLHAAEQRQRFTGKPRPYRKKRLGDTADTEPAVVTPGPALTNEFSAQYIRTDGYDEKRSYPAATLITSADELKAYYDATKAPLTAKAVNQTARIRTL